MLKITNPATGKIVAEVLEDNAASIKRKYMLARDAQPAWAAKSLGHRTKVIRAFRAQVAARKDELARILVSETGKPLQQAMSELNGLLPRIEFFLDHARKTLRPRKVHDQDGMTEVISHEPLGVIANISAWNYPYFVGANVFVPALLTGNAVLYKPSEFATRTGLEIAEMLYEAGVPQTVFTTVIGTGTVGAALLKQPVDGVFFTGSAATGKAIAKAVAGRMIKLQLELGGKDPVYVCDDVDPVAAAAGLADGAMYNAGQSCCAVERIYVHENIYQPFVDAFIKEVKGFKIGDPLAEGTYIGPLTRAPQIKVLEAQIADATKKGARLAIGGKRIRTRGLGKGNYFQPTVLLDVDHSMTVMRDESFGPIIGIQSVQDDAEAMVLMNDTSYGLTAGVFTKDRKRAERMLGQARAGTVYWNCCDRVSPRLPWSGVGDSGIGLTLSTYGIETFTRPKAWHLRKA
ncbi:MAG: aldehyde dehydrogenase family protein [Betaproteobacteria bacterium]|nr:aldehyde dehydrogenase family protein [Betaproteobacteria bacterium]